MIISTAKDEQLLEFETLMKNTDNVLNVKAVQDENYYNDKSGKKLEVEVYNALDFCARGTKFEGTIRLVSGASFPDIIANRYYGVEVKSTEKDHWQSIGSSILESTRDKDVERIYLTFGKLGRPVSFISKPYEDCLADIVVTHYPRYRIDMKLQEKGEKTIFEKMGVDYETLRKMPSPVPTVSNYYKKNLKPGQSLWWASDNIEEVAAPMTARLWTTLSASEKTSLANYGYAFFPETITMTGALKYQRYALWLATEKGVINTNIRDSFSAGGQFEMKYPDGTTIKLPAVFGRIASSKKEIINIISSEDEENLKEYWSVDRIEEDKISQWKSRIIKYANQQDAVEIIRFLNHIF